MEARVAPKMAGMKDDVRKVFRIVKGGTVPAISIATHGNTVDELDNLPNISIKGNMVEGEIFIPGAELDLTDVTGEAVVSGRVLKGKNLFACMKTF